jgi:hypothetical protein
MAQQRSSFTTAENHLRDELTAAVWDRDVALARVERVIAVLSESRGTTVSVRKIERAVG